VVFGYPTLDDLPDTYARLKGLHIEPLLAADHGPTISLYYADPDGNSVELLVDNCGNWDLSQEYMRTSPEFAARPMGTCVDPDHLLAARQAGASFAELHRRAYAGELAPAGPVDPRILI
jgi:catechol 2,3-dioxygenase